MKLKMLVVPAILALAISANAGSSKTVKLYSDANVNGTALAAGEYKVTVDDSGAVTFAQGKNVVAKAQGKIVSTDKAARANTVTTRSGKLSSIQFEGSKQQVVLEEGSGTVAGSR
jgi:hypothetical protein